METETKLIAKFLSVAVGQSAATATQYLTAAGWKLDGAIELFFAANEPGHGGYNPFPIAFNQPGGLLPWPPIYNPLSSESTSNAARPPLPAVGEALNEYMARREEKEQKPRPDDSSESISNQGPNKHIFLFQPPLTIMHNGSLENAKIVACDENKWLLLNVQSIDEFNSHMLNRDTWTDETLVQAIKASFIFSQVNHNSIAGVELCRSYNLVSLPAILVIDPITGEKLQTWSGMVQPERLLDDLLRYMDHGPRERNVDRPKEAIPSSSSALENTYEVAPSTAIPSSSSAIPSSSSAFENTYGVTPYSAIPSSSSALENTYEVTPHSADPYDYEEEAVLRALAASLEDMKVSTRSSENRDVDKKPMYPRLPEEPKVEFWLLCRVGIKLPDGRRRYRNFLGTDPVQFLWSFCDSLLEKGETRPFHFTYKDRGFWGEKRLDYEDKLTFDEAGLSNSLTFLIFD